MQKVKKYLWTTISYKSIGHKGEAKVNKRRVWMRQNGPSAFTSYAETRLDLHSGLHK